LKKKYTLAETFVGAGGSHLGFRQAGFKSIYVNEFDANFVKTLLINNPELTTDAFIDDRDIIDVDPRSILKKCKLKKSELDVLFGGVVCKGFSMAGERSPNDNRNFLYHEQLKLVSELKPKISIIENVPGISNATVLSPKTPSSFKRDIDDLWQSLADYKGQKAELRKKNALTNEFEQNGNFLKLKKKKILEEAKAKGYLIPVMEDIYKIYEKMGYQVQHMVLNAAWYGAATKRQRIVIVAVRDDLESNFIFPIPTHFTQELVNRPIFDKKKIDLSKLKKAVTVGEALSTIDYSNKEDLDNNPMKHDKKTVRRFKFIPEGDSITNHLDKLPPDLVISSFYSRGNTMRLARNSPSPTLVPGHSNFPVHPTEHRSISVREAASITGFPNNYTFVGTHTKRCEQVGNAVPPPLAFAIAKSCVDLLNKLRN